MQEKTRIRELLENILPPILFRNNPKFKEWTGRSSRTVANADSKGQGPTERLLVGHVVGYPKDAIIKWLEKKVKE